MFFNIPRKTAAGSTMNIWTKQTTVWTVHNELRLRQDQSQAHFSAKNSIDIQE
jgi:hypothetical protein